VQILADWAEERFPLYAYHPHAICRRQRYALSWILCLPALRRPGEAEGALPAGRRNRGTIGNRARSHGPRPRASGVTVLVCRIEVHSFCRLSR
jgi:hypothetical protein